jgi:hypothetical protein
VSRKGEVKCESFIQYADYTWECPMPLLGGWKWQEKKKTKEARIM